MKTVYTIMGLLALGFLGVIAFNSSIGKTLPNYHSRWMACNDTLAQALFYSSLLGQTDDLKKLAAQVKNAKSVPEIELLVTSGSNIDASRTKWYASLSQQGSCQAQIFLQHPKSDGDNTAYVGYTLKGYVSADESETQLLLQSEVLESIHINALGISWFKQ